MLSYLKDYLKETRRKMIAGNRGCNLEEGKVMFERKSNDENRCHCREMSSVKSRDWLNESNSAEYLFALFILVMNWILELA